MSEIWNLSTLCRCCHSDGNFKSLEERYPVGETTEVYESMLKDTFAVAIFLMKTSTFEASYTICDECIRRLRDAADFKKQVLQCEEKFLIYCKNEQVFTLPGNFVKVEVDGAHHYPESDDECKIDVDIKRFNTPKEVELSSDLKKEIKDEMDTISKKITKEKKPSFKIKSERNKTNSRKSTKLKRSLYIATGIIQTLNKTKNVNTYLCKACNTEHPSKLLIENHIHNKHPEVTSYKCEKCCNLFLTKNAFTNHMKLHGTKEKKIRMKKINRTVTCNICKKVLCNNASLQKHYRWHKGTNKSELCEICGHGFNDKANLKIHIRTVHEKLRPFACDICGATYTAKKHLKKHIIAHMLSSGEIEASEKILHTCAICKKMFKCPKSLKRHKLLHENKYQCTVCDEIFNDQLSYKSHTHQGSKMKYYCHICNKELASSFTLKRHLTNHKDSRDFACDKCPLRFNDKYQLKRHVFRIHIANVGSTKFQCLVCKRRVKDIDKHMTSHEFKKFSCPYCSSCYVENKSLKRHIKAIHSDAIISCDVCGKKVISIQSLERHKSRLHSKLKSELDEINA